MTAAQTTGYVDLSGARQALQGEVNKKVKPEAGESPEAAEQRRVTLLSALMSMLRRLINRLSRLLGLKPEEPEALKKDRENQAAQEAERMSFAADMPPKELEAVLANMRKHVDAFVKGVKEDQLGFRLEDLGSEEAVRNALTRYQVLLDSLDAGQSSLSSKIAPEVEALRANFPQATTEAIERMILEGDAGVRRSLLGDKPDLLRLLQARERAREMAWTMHEHAATLIDLFAARPEAAGANLAGLRVFIGRNLVYKGPQPYSVRPKGSPDNASVPAEKREAAQAAPTAQAAAPAAPAAKPKLAFPANRGGFGGEGNALAGAAKPGNIAWLRKPAGPAKPGVVVENIAQNSNLCDKRGVGGDDDIGEEGTTPAVLKAPSWAVKAASPAPQEECSPPEVDRPKGG